MEKTTVFVKTKEGEEAMRQRTRLVQRNLRNILIMVDGRATVAELSQRFGDRNAAENALAELAAGGFIRALEDRQDSSETTRAEAPAGQVEDVPVLTSRIAPIPASAAAAGPPPAGESGSAMPEYESLPPPNVSAAAPSSPPTALPAARPGWLERIRGVFAGAEKPATPAPALAATAAGESQEALPGDADFAAMTAGGRIGWPRLALLGLVGAAVLAILTLLFYPYGRHLPDIERNVSDMVGAPVRIGGIEFAFLPRPHIALRNLSVGQEAPLLRIGAVRATPEFLSLLGGKKVFRQVILEQVALDAAGLGRLTRARAATAALQIRQLRLEGLNLVVAETALAGHNGEVILDASGAVAAIEVRNADRTLRIRLEPKGETYRIAASADVWKTPFRPMLTFQSLEAEGELRPDRLTLTRIDARTLDGLLAGKAVLAWNDGATLAAEVELKRVSAEKLLAAVASDLSVTGELGARLKIAASADGLGRLSEAVHATGAFEMGRGTVRGIDLVEAARARGPTRGGETKFEQLAGLVECEPGACRLGRLQLVSGLLTAGGSLDIQRDGVLAGTLNAELRSSVATVRVALAVGGSAKDPELAPARRR